jgi:nucleoid DNA-binding protein
MNLNQTNLISKDKIKDVLINKTAARANKSTTEVDNVISFVFKDAWKAFRTANSVEISGFGVYKVSLKKLKKDLQLKETRLRALKNLYEKKPREITKKFIDNLEELIADGKTRLNELEKS